jgi:curved DNA-binding protein CbpA
MQPNKELYQLLGLPREASEDDIQRAHRKLVREYHPDANPKDPEPRSALRRYNRPTKSCRMTRSGASTTRRFTPPL